MLLLVLLAVLLVVLRVLLGWARSGFASLAAMQFSLWPPLNAAGHRSTQCPSTTEPQEACDFNHTVAAYDPELYLRWVQWGAHSPILRTHPQPDPHVERRAWGYSLPVSEYMRAAFSRRARLVPSLFTVGAFAARRAQKRGRMFRVVSRFYGMDLPLGGPHSPHPPPHLPRATRRGAGQLRV